MAEDDDLELEEDFGEESDVVVIIDNGSGTCKAGLSTDTAPTAVFPEVVGRPRKLWRSQLDKDIYLGDQVDSHRSKLTCSHPLENGIIENFENMELLWEYTFDEMLKVNPAEHPLLLTEPPYNPKPNRERMVEVMFESFGVPVLNISIQGVLALLGQGRTTGLVLDSGDGVTHTIPIFDGFGMPHCINRLDLAGRDLTVLLGKFLAQEGYCLTTTSDMDQVRRMKEQQCYVSQDPSTEFAEQEEFRLPDGRVIPLADERWKCPETLFNPSQAGLESQGVAGLVWESIKNCEIDLRRTLLSNVVLSGGSTMFQGFPERLTKELRSYAPTATQGNIRVVQTADRKYAVWTGAQVFATLRNMQEDQWISYEEYEEYGARYIHDKISVKYK